MTSWTPLGGARIELVLIRFSYTGSSIGRSTVIAAGGLTLRHSSENIVFLVISFWDTFWGSRYTFLSCWSQTGRPKTKIKNRANDILKLKKQLDQFAVT